AVADVVVLGPEADPVETGSGCGVVVLLDGADLGRGAAAVLERSGIASLGPIAGSHSVVAAGLEGPDLLAWTDGARFAVRAALEVSDRAVAALRVEGEPGAPGPIAAALAEAPGPSGERAVILGIDVLASADPLARVVARNAIIWAARRPAGPQAGARRAAELVEHPAWLGLKAAVGELQQLQGADGAVVDEPERASALVEQVPAHLAALAPSFPHDDDYLLALGKDLQRWREQGLGVPDFYDSLVAFRPELQRVDGLRHLVVFPMYTQNGRTD